MALCSGPVTGSQPNERPPRLLAHHHCKPTAITTPNNQREGFSRSMVIRFDSTLLLSQGPPFIYFCLRRGLGLVLEFQQQVAA